MGFLSGKKALITGVASHRSIAWGIALAMVEQGCQLAFTYQNDKLKSRVQKCAQLCHATILMACDMSSDESITKTFDHLKTHWQSVDIIIHSVAFAPQEALAGDYLQATTRENFLTAHNISSYSFTALAKAAKPMLNTGGSMLTISYLGAQRAITNYNVMGIAKASLEANVRYMAASLGKMNVRVNAISAGPIKTLAASGIKNFSKLLDYAANNSALGRNITTEEVGNVAAFLSSDLASAITGEVVYVDGGYNFCDKGPI